MHTSRAIPTARDLAHYLPWDVSCNCHRSFAGPNPQSFFAIDVRDSSLNIGVNEHTNAKGWDPDRRDVMMSMGMDMEMSTRRASADSSLARVLYPAAEREWLLDSLVRRVRRQTAVDRGFTFVVDRRPGAARIFAYTLMPTAWGDTLIYGARYSPDAFNTILATSLDENGLLPETFVAGKRNRDVLAVAVRDSAGNPIWSSDSSIASYSQGAHIALPTRAGNLQVDAVLRPQMAGTLLIGGLPASRLPFLLGLLALAAALSIVAVTQLRREGELARLRSDFVSSVSHELRTPVAQIRLYLETLQLGRASTPDQQKWAFGHIERETTRLSHLVEKVLRFSSLSMQDAPARDPIDAANEIRAIVDEFAPLAKSRRARIEVGTEATAPVRVRPDALRHIVINLLDNALKYGPVDQLVTVSVARENGSVAIAVDDEGPGVPAPDREAIWRPFTRGGAASETGGSGIGLTIVRQVVVAHGGSARVEQGARGGARFVVTLPAAELTPS
jgi:signal transduction histidine kinase